MSKESWFRMVDCTIISERERSFEVLYRGKQYFIPFSQVHPDQVRGTDESQRGLFGDLPDTKLRERQTGVCVVITEWLAKQKGLL